MELFASLRKVRELERAHLPFIKSIIEFDIVIEVGYAEETGRPLSLKQLFLLNISSRTTVRRRLADLIEQDIIKRDKHSNDQRSALLTISPAGIKVFTRYWGALTALSSPVPKKV